MSQENVEVVRALYEAWNSGDMVALREVLHPAIKYINPNDAIETGTHTGVDAYEAMVERLKDTFEEAHFDIDEFLEDRKSTRLNSSHTVISYAVFCLKKKKEKSVNEHKRTTQCIDY